MRLPEEVSHNQEHSARSTQAVHPQGARPHLPTCIHAASSSCVLSATSITSSAADRGDPAAIKRSTRATADGPLAAEPASASTTHSEGEVMGKKGPKNL